MSAAHREWIMQAFEDRDKRAYLLTMDKQKSEQIVPSVGIRYVGFGQLTVYLVSEDELRLIETGGPSSTYLNLAILFLSAGASFFASLVVSPPSGIHSFTVMTVLTVASLIAGTVLLVLWRRSSKVASAVIHRIRARGTPPSQATIIETSTTEGPSNP